MIYPTELIESIQAQYDIQTILKFSDFDAVNGKNAVYDQLKSVHKDAYTQDERILIVQDRADIYHYPDLPGLTLTNLQKILAEIDISNDFVLLVTNDAQVLQDVETVRHLYSSNQHAIQVMLDNSGAAFERKLAKGDTLCVLPWLHVYVGPDGNVLPCCHAEQKFPLGNINQDDLDVISNSPQFRRLRQNMLDGYKCKECASCYAIEEFGQISARNLFNRKYLHRLTSHSQLTATVDQFNPIYLDIRASNICNLRCRMCSPYFSSSLAQENKEIFGQDAGQDFLLNADRKQLLAQLQKWLPTAERIYFAGGEPLLTAEHYDIMDALIAHDNRNLEIFYNTNLTTLKFRERSVLDLWKHFTNVTVGASLDCQGAQAEYIRYGSDWQAIMHNIDDIKSQCSHVRLMITSIATMIGTQSLIDAQKQLVVDGKINIENFTVRPLHMPRHLSLTALPQHHKISLAAVIERHILWCNSRGSESLGQQWKTVLEYMMSCDDQYQLHEFRRLTKIYDQHRNQSFAKIFPVYQDLLR